MSLKLNSRFSFYYRLPILEKRLKKNAWALLNCTIYLIIIYFECSVNKPQSLSNVFLLKFSRYQESKLSVFWIAIKLGKIEGGKKLIYFNKNYQALRLKTHTKSRVNFLMMKMKKKNGVNSLTLRFKGTVLDFVGCHCIHSFLCNVSFVFERESENDWERYRKIYFIHRSFVLICMAW